MTREQEILEEICPKGLIGRAISPAKLAAYLARMESTTNPKQISNSLVVPKSEEKEHGWCHFGHIHTPYVSPENPYYNCICGEDCESDKHFGICPKATPPSEENKKSLNALSKLVGYKEYGSPSEEKKCKHQEEIDKLCAAYREKYPHASVGFLTGSSLVGNKEGDSARFWKLKNECEKKCSPTPPDAWEGTVRLIFREIDAMRSSDDERQEALSREEIYKLIDQLGDQTRTTTLEEVERVVEEARLLEVGVDSIGLMWKQRWNGLLDRLLATVSEMKQR